MACIPGRRIERLMSSLQYQYAVLFAIWSRDKHGNWRGRESGTSLVDLQWGVDALGAMYARNGRPLCATSHPQGDDHKGVPGVRMTRAREIEQSQSYNVPWAACLIHAIERFPTTAVV